ncbi:MAG: hypothetical protein LC099_10530 [Anaerolineales bacterium]|nr:hypothetical protein [Anaerolineales bacterium]
MKTKKFLIVSAALVVLTAFLILLNFNVHAAAPSAALALQQATPTPFADASEVGSTNGILVMGVVIVLIIISPLIFRKKK